MKWKPAKINDRWLMTRVEGDAIASRRMKWYEKIRYWYLKGQ
jgi:hypothetical protein